MININTTSTLIVIPPLIAFSIVIFILWLVTYPFIWSFMELKGDDGNNDYYGRF